MPSNRFDRINFLLALIGLTADVLGIYVFFSVKPQDSEQQDVSHSNPETLFLFILFYSWLLISWELTKRKTKSNIEQGEGKFTSTVLFSTGVVGLASMLISAVFSFYKKAYIYSIIHIGFFVPIAGIIYLLGIITSINIDSKYFGRYRCFEPYTNPLNNDRFKVGDDITVYKKSNNAEEYFYTSRQGQKRAISRSDIAHFFLKITQNQIH